MARKKKTKINKKDIRIALSIIAIIITLIGGLFVAKENGYLGSPQTNDNSSNSLTSSVVTGIGEVEYHFIDVGQGDATLIRTPDGDILIDTGENSAEDALRAYLDNCGVETLSYAVFTHPDSDHIGGADMILKEYVVEKVIKPDFEKTTQVYKKMMEAIEAEGCEVYNVLPGETYSLGEFDMFILSPDPNADLDSNNSSVVIRATWGETTAMLTGDAEEPAEKVILGAFTKEYLSSNLLKVGHHGSRTSSTVGWLSAVDPDIAVISCGTGNSYGHPHTEVLDKLKAYVGEDRIYRTDLLGSIVIVTDGVEFTFQD